MESPYLTQASFCERVLNEQDGVISAIRIIDTYRIELKGSKEILDDPALRKSALHSLYLLITIKSGDFKGKGNVSVRAIGPDGKPTGKSPATMPIELNGGVHGVNIVVQVGIAMNVSGTYWYEVSFNDRLLTRTPIAVSVTVNQTELQPATKNLPSK